MHVKLFNLDIQQVYAFVNINANKTAVQRM